LRDRLPAEFTAPDDERLVQKAAALQISEQRGDRPVDFGSVDGQILFLALVSVPVFLLMAAAGIELHEPHAPLDQPPRDQALSAKPGGAVRQFVVRRPRLIQAVHFKRLGRFGRQIEGLGRGRLKLKGKLIRGDPGRQLGIAGPRGKMLSV